ncbi:MAG: TonB-dependent receptor [Rikenellaceae bacterium]|jgi:hypothetical protein|nr:TonB-dependent receptor [Rikenellaceae bacterium]
MKRIFLLAIFCLTVMGGYAQQTFTLRGNVVDAGDNSPMVGALVMIDSIHHVTTDLYGTFSVPNVPAKETTMVVTFMGYGTITRTIDVNRSTANLGTIRMTEEGNMIDKVVVEARSNLAVQKGDTTQYNASAFKTNPDADAADLASKMPGITISDGEVQSQGEAVQRAYVDGKLSFGDDVMAVLRNLPADAVESIQMFDELSDEAKFLGYDDGRTTRALNIVTKHKSNRSYMGRLEAGIGAELQENSEGENPLRYLFGGNATMIGQKNRWSINGLVNNVNQQRFSGQSSNTGGGAAAMFMGSNGVNTIRNLGFSYSGEWGEAVKFTGNYMFDNSSSDVSSRRVQNYFPTDQWDTRVYVDTTYSNPGNQNHRVNGRLEVESGRNRLLFTPGFSYRDNTSDTWRRATSIVDGVPTTRMDMLNYNATDGYNAGGELMWTLRLGTGAKTGRALTTTFRLSANDNDGDGWQRDTTETTTNRTWLTNTNNSWSRQFRGRLTYAEPLGKYSRVLLSYRLGYNNSESEVIYLDEDQGGIIDPTRSNTFTRNYTSQSGQLDYTFTKDKIRLSAGLEYEAADMNNDQTIPTRFIVDRNFYTWKPDVQLRYNFSKSRNLRIGYEGENSLPSVEELQNVIDARNPMQLTSGNPELGQSYDHDFSVRYTSSNVLKSTNFYLQARAAVTQDYIGYHTLYFENETVLTAYNNYVAQAGSQLRTPTNLDGRFSASAMVSYNFPIRALKSNFNMGTRYSYNITPSYTTDNRLNKARTNSGNLMLGLVSNISQNVDFSVMSSSGYNVTANSAKDNHESFSQRASGMLNIIMLKGIVLNTAYTFNYIKNTSNEGFTQHYSLWNAGLGYKFTKRKTAEARVTVYDILRQNRSLRHSIADAYVQDSWTNTMGRYVMFTLSYRFNSMNTPVDRKGEGVDFRPGDRGYGRGGMQGPPPGGGRFGGGRGF